MSDSFLVVPTLASCAVYYASSGKVLIQPAVPRPSLNENRRLVRRKRSVELQGMFAWQCLIHLLRVSARHARGVERSQVFTPILIDQAKRLGPLAPSLVWVPLAYPLGLTPFEQPRRPLCCL